ncbi:hypothetical protein JTB14_004200 [Gonioctena quinquepunctata]|nr:hypothetical protein JTB14_004200 [Gonioctena quinquepunctata]
MGRQDTGTIPRTDFSYLPPPLINVPNPWMSSGLRPPTPGGSYHPYKRWESEASPYRVLNPRILPRCREYDVPYHKIHHPVFGSQVLRHQVFTVPVGTQVPPPNTASSKRPISVPFCILSP